MQVPRSLPTGLCQHPGSFRPARGVSHLFGNLFAHIIRCICRLARLSPDPSQISISATANNSRHTRCRSPTSSTPSPPPTTESCLTDSGALRTHAAVQTSLLQVDLTRFIIPTYILADNSSTCCSLPVDIAPDLLPPAIITFLARSPYHPK